MNKEAMYKAERLFGHSWQIASPHCACWYMHEALMKAQHVSVCPRSRFLHVAHLDVFACLWWVRTFMQCEFCITVFTCVLGRGWSSCWLLCQPLLSCNKAWFKVGQSATGRVPRRSFPLQPVEMRSLHNIYPGNNDVWFDSLLGVSLQGLFSSTADTERENRQKRPQEQRKKPQIIVYGWCWVGVFLCLAIRMKSCCVALLVAWLTLGFLSFLLDAPEQLRLDSLNLKCSTLKGKAVPIEQ